MSLNNNFIVVLRSVSERTEKACYHSILNQIKDESKIHITRISPFKSALEYGYELAIKKKMKWLLTADADTVLIPDTLDKFFLIAEEMPDHYLQVQGRILDKITGTIRRGGPRIYRVEHLKKALLLSESSDDTIRPEQYIIRKMGEMGYPSRYISPVLCIHDFEQYYRDIYRNAYVHANKHIDLLPTIITNALTLKTSEDQDYKIIIKGLKDGIFGHKEQFINDNLYIDDARKAIHEVELSEKCKLDSLIDVENIINQYSISNNDLTFEKNTFKDIPSNQPVIIKVMKSKGFFRGSINILGLILNKAANFLLKKS